MANKKVTKSNIKKESKKDVAKKQKNVSEKELKKVTKKLKLNDKVTGKDAKYISEEAREIRRFVFILIGIIVAILIVYGITVFFKKDNKSLEAESTAEGAINYDLVSVGTMLNRNNSEYYVIVYAGKNPEAVLYSTVVNKYLNKEKALDVYFCDLDNKLNKDYYVGEDGKSNPKAKNVNDLAFRDLTLVKVKKGEIVKYIEGLDAIRKEFGN